MAARWSATVATAADTYRQDDVLSISDIRRRLTDESDERVMIGVIYYIDLKPDETNRRI